MRRRAKIAFSTLLAIFLYGQVNAVLHFIFVEHDYCIEHATATQHEDEDDHSKEKDQRHSEHEDCPVLAQLTRLAASAAPDLAVFVDSDVLFVIVLFESDFLSLDQSELFILSPSNSPPLPA